MYNKMWFIEHKIRALIDGRGMRPGRAIRRLYPRLSDAAVASLVACWQAGEGEFGLITSETEPDLWVRAYDEIRSCMQGKGALCRRAYERHGVQVVALADSQGRLRARCLVQQHADGLLYAAPQYGEYHYQLADVLRLIGVVVDEVDWFEGNPRSLILYEDRREKREVVLPAGWSKYHSRVPAGTVASRPGRYSDIRPCTFMQGWVLAREWLPEQVRSINVYARTVLFSPYLDGYGFIRV